MTPRPAQDRTVGEFVRDAVADTVGVDGRLWVTLAALFGAPGQLTDAYVAGRGGGFLRPAQTYLVLSLALFSLLQVADPGDALGRRLLDSEREFLASGSPSARDERVRDLERRLSAAVAERDSAAGAVRQAEDLLAAARRGERAGDVAAFLVPQADAATAPPRRYGNEERIGLAQAEVAGTLLEWLPVLLVVLVPVYALGVYLLAGQRRSGTVAVVLSVHAHAAGFGAFVVVVALAIGAGWAAAAAGSGLALAALAVWQAAALRRVYGAGRTRAALVAVGWGAAYGVGVLLSLGFAYAVALFVVVGPS